MDMPADKDNVELSLETNIKLNEVKPSTWVGRSFRIFLLIILPIGLLGGAIAYKTILDGNKPDVKPDEIVEKSATVETLTAKYADVRPTVEIYGQTVAGKQLNLRANVGGEVVQISPHFKSGALVDMGELLFTIDPFAYEGALLSAQNNYADTLTNIDELKLRSKSEEISLGTAKEQLSAAQKDYERGVTLRKRGTITTKALDDKLLAVTQRQQSVDLAENTLQAQISQMKRYETGLKNIQWSIDKAQRDLDHTKIYAAFDAYVQNANMQIGQLASTNEQVATLIDRSQMDIVFTLSDSLYGRILAQDGTLIGRDVNLIWKAGNATQNFTATIDRVAAQITASSGGIELFAQIKGLEDIATLRVGSFMTVEIPDQIFTDVLRVPEHIIYDGDKLYILDTRDVVVAKTETKMAEKSDEKATEKTTKNEEKQEAKTETRLRPVKITTIGYDGKYALVTSADADDLIKNGDVILATKLSSAGTDVLVITRIEAEKLREERLKNALAENKAKLETETAEKAGE